MTDERYPAVVFLAVAIVSAFTVNSPAGLALVALSLVALLVGYRRRWTPSTAVAGLFMYYPCADLFGRVIPGEWGYVASAILLIPLSERLSFEYQMSSALEAPRGIDEGSGQLASRLKKSHGMKLFWYVGVAFAVSTASLLASALTRYSPILAAISVLLFFALWTYTRR
jgi:hypothetical protein